VLEAQDLFGCLPWAYQDHLGRSLLAFRLLLPQREWRRTHVAVEDRLAPCSACLSSRIRHLQGQLRQRSGSCDLGWRRHFHQNMVNPRRLSPAGMPSPIQKIKLSEPVINFNLGFSGAYLIAIESDGRLTVLNML
jgi:hypothetical protein